MSLRSAGRARLSSSSKALQVIPKRAYASHGHGHHDQPHPYTYPPETLTTRPFQLSAAAILAALGLIEAGFFDRKDGQHPITKWIKSRHPTDEELLRNRLLTLQRAAKVSSNNRTAATARRPSYKRVKNTSVFTNGSPYNVPVGSIPTVHNTKIVTDHSERELFVPDHPLRAGVDADGVLTTVESVAVGVDAALGFGAAYHLGISACTCARCVIVDMFALGEL